MGLKVMKGLKATPRWVRHLRRRLLLPPPVLLLLLDDLLPGNLPEMSPVPGGDAAAAVHHDLVLPVSEGGGDDTGAVPLRGPGGGLVLYPDLVPDLQWRQLSGPLVVGVHHDLDPLGSH